ncbi:MAG TPA: hypothetical protein VGU22_18275 [Methylomirabilota bacterium]|nr:hypothetical protein [Methylomirabilota bacterium]
MAEIIVDIGGIAISVVTHDQVIVDVVEDRYKGFLADRGPDWRLEMGVGPVVPGADHDVVVEGTGAAGCFRVRRYDFVGMLELGRHAGRVTLLDPDEITLDSFFRIAYSLMLLERGGLILHSASLVRNHRAWVFCGPSGSGKTTIARMSHDVTVLSDELSILRVTDHGVVAHGTPFWGDLARGGDNVCVDVAGLYMLRQGARHAVEPLAPGRALAALLPNVMFFAKDAGLTRTLLSIAGALVESVECATLTFSRDPGFWEVIDA